MQDALFNVLSQSVTSNDYYTPKWVFETLNVEFDIDVCAPVHGIPWIPAKRWFSQIDDGLAQDWAGNFVWMNPPYSQPAAWAEKFVENANGLALMPTARSDWFNFMWERVDAVTIMPVKMEFERPNEKSKTIAFHTMLFAMGKTAVKTLNASKIGHVR